MTLRVTFHSRSAQTEHGGGGSEAGALSRAQSQSSVSFKEFELFPECCGEALDDVKRRGDRIK